MSEGKTYRILFAIHCPTAWHAFLPTEISHEIPQWPPFITFSGLVVFTFLWSAEWYHSFTMYPYLLWSLHLPGCPIPFPSASSWSHSVTALLHFFSHCSPSFLLSVGISHSLALCAHASICLEDLSSSRTYFSLHEDDSWSPISRLTLSLLTWGSSMKLLDRKHKLSMIKSKFIFSTLKWFSLLFSLYLLGLFPHIQSQRSSRSSKILSKVIFPALPLYSIIFGSTQHVSNNPNIAFFSFYSN